ncbi:hypothetical protein TNCV_1416851 [Trichonephila clavipes]|nr:hypothetical protein TNCV_1416851 [Trichonephila clavipes]
MGRHVMSSSPVPLKTHRVGQRCTLNLSRLKRSPIGVVWKLGEEGSSSDTCKSIETQNPYICVLWKIEEWYASSGQRVHHPASIMVSWSIRYEGVSEIRFCEKEVKTMLQVISTIYHLRINCEAPEDTPAQWKLLDFSTGLRSCSDKAKMTRSVLHKTQRLTFQHSRFKSSRLNIVLTFRDKDMLKKSSQFEVDILFEKKG